MDWMYKRPGDSTNLLISLSSKLSLPRRLLITTYKPTSGKMVNFAPLSFAAMSLFTLVSTAPLTVTTEEPVFSFAKWVDDIIANPETALGPEEAWQAYLNSVNSTSSSIGPLTARDAAVTCQDLLPGPAYVSSSSPTCQKEVKLIGLGILRLLTPSGLSIISLAWGLTYASRSLSRTVPRVLSSMKLPRSWVFLEAVLRRVLGESHPFLSFFFSFPVLEIATNHETDTASLTQFQPTSCPDCRPHHGQLHQERLCRGLAYEHQLCCTDGGIYPALFAR